MTQVQYKYTSSKVGNLYLVASEKGLQSIHQVKQNIPMVRLENSPVLQATVKELEQYFAGSRTQFNVPLDLIGTSFQKKVWNELLKIPYGKTCSYKDIAKKIKQETASRAVGTANGKNPLWIIIPCHRVIASNGNLGGYAGGLPMKKKLLQLESATN
jgi:methylated-DNA-[protein]-cysteine S-methyltransferase